MMDEQTKQAITNAMKQLNDENPSVRIEGAKKLGEIDIDHPKIIERLESVASDDFSAEVQHAAKNNLMLLQNISTSYDAKDSSSPKETDLENETSIIELLQEQNRLLKKMNKLMVRGIQAVDDDEIFTNTEITDVNISISSLANLMFKWIIASIPVGILVWIIVAILSAVFGGIFLSLF